MANVRHRNITEGEKHEPKNFGSGAVYSRLLKDENSQSRYAKEAFLEPALNFLDGNGTAPASPTVGDIYVLIDEGNGTIDASWDDASYNDWVRYNGVEWVAVTPTSGNICADLTADTLKTFDGTNWGNLSNDLGSADLTQSDAVREYDVNANTSLDIVNGATKLFRFFTDKIQSLKRLVIGSGADDDSAMLAINVSDKGLLIPRGTESDMNGIATPATDLLFQRTDDNGNLWRYDGASWVKLTAGYGVIEVIRDSDDGIPSYFADLQSALETCKASGSFNKITLFSNVDLTSGVLAESGGSGIGFNYGFSSLEFDFNGFEVSLDTADEETTIEVSVSNSNVHFIQPKISRTNSVGSSGGVALNLTSNTMSYKSSNGGRVYSQNRQALKAFGLASDVIIDFGNCIFESDVLGSTFHVATDVKEIRNVIVKQNATTNVRGCYLLRVNNIRNMTVEHLGEDWAIDTFQDVENYYDVKIKAPNGKGLSSTTEFVNLFYCDFESKNETLTKKINVHSGKYKSINGTTILSLEGVVYGGEFESVNNQVIAGTNTGEFKSGDYVSRNGLGVVRGNITGSNKLKFTKCFFENKNDSATAHCVDFSAKGTGLIQFDKCEFKVTNTGANCLYSSVAKSDIKVTGSSYEGATTPVNTNVTLTSLTDNADHLGNTGNGLVSAFPKMTTAERDALTLGASNEGYTVDDTDDNNRYRWNGTEFTKINVPNNFVYVSAKSDLPAPASNVITLENNYTYYFTNDVDLGGDRLVAGIDTVILGPSSENAKITSTGLDVGVAFLTSTNTTVVKDVTITDVDTAFDFDGTGNDMELNWTGVNVENVPNIGTFDNVGNFIFTKGALLNSQGLVFSGTQGTISFNESFFMGDGTAGDIIEVDALANISRRFRIIYSSFVADTSTNAINVNASATIPVESYILDTVNFSGTGTFLTGLDEADNEALFTNCVGIKNTAVNGQIYMNDNATATTIADTTTFVKVAGTTTTSADNSKYTMPVNNRLENDAVIERKFLIQCTLSFTSGNNNECEFGFYDSKLSDIRTPSETKATANSAGKAENINLACVVSHADGDFLEIHCRNNTATTDITVTDLNFLITEI